ncbi:hypothetical protein [Trichothermofontia sp.]
MLRSFAAATTRLPRLPRQLGSIQSGIAHLPLLSTLGTALLYLVLGSPDMARSQVKFAPYQVPIAFPEGGRSRSVSTGESRGVSAGELPVQFAPYQLSAITTAPVQITLGNSLPWISFDIGGNPDTARPLTLWASYYNMRLSRQVKNGYALLDPAGHPLSPRLSHEDWCHAAMQGSV